MPTPRRILVLGSGALTIGQAGEFDYSGSQAIKAFKEEGIETVLINPNIATNQTSQGLADRVYFLPVTPDFVERVIAEARPDALALSFGGQTALNCGVALDESGVLRTHGVRVLGTPVETIRATEDRQLFVKKLDQIGVRTARARAVKTIPAGLVAARTIGYPVICRAAFALGGRGSGFAENDAQLRALLAVALASSPQALIEEDLRGWKEIEYEVVRDSADTALTICNMENFDPLGIHTGESIVVAPSQTLNNAEYHGLREIALRTIRYLGVVGECNIQYAVHPSPTGTSLEYRVIEVNARLSRSSALASKATGYPLAFIAAKLALGARLDQLTNAVTGTTACFEPALDYLALKVPRWDLQKFQRVDPQIGSEMKSVGEVMAIGRSFPEVLQKALRMLQIGAQGFSAEGVALGDLAAEIRAPTPHRVFALAAALARGWSVDRLYALSKIDPWFLEQCKQIVDFEQATLRASTRLTTPQLREAKQLGFSDASIGARLGLSDSAVRTLRKQARILPVIKKIDTVAAEHPARTNYLYFTYHGQVSDPIRASRKKTVVVLGSGAYCIGSSVEFDWSCVSAVRQLRRRGYQTAMINYNPETVSTDYDTCHQLYFDELSLERVLDVVDLTRPAAVLVSTGGQIPQTLAGKLADAGVRILGTSPVDIDRAESRDKFSALCDELGVDQPAWAEFAQIREAYQFAQRVGYPVLVRPSYVLSGAAMSVAHNQSQLKEYINAAGQVSRQAPVVISKFETRARELDFDGVAHDGKLLIYAVSEHIEQAGVHSGDATLVLPPQRTYLETIRRIKKISKRLVAALSITGPFNIQFLAKENRIKVIEMNLRASRSVPFVSKASGHDFIEIAIDAMLGRIRPKAWRKQHYQTLDSNYVCVKAPQFSFARLRGADPTLGVEMSSTGEVACFGRSLDESLLKAYLATGFCVPRRAVLISAGTIADKVALLPAVRGLQKLGLTVYGTPGTATFCRGEGVSVRSVTKPSSVAAAQSLLRRHGIDLIVNIPSNYRPARETAGYCLRRASVDLSISLLVNVQIARSLTDALVAYADRALPVDSWDSYG